MKSKLILSLVAVIAAVSVSANAQEGKTPGQVVLLDVAKVFRVNKEFDDGMKSIKAEAQTLKNEIEAKQKKLQEEAVKVANTFEVGTSERNQKEAQLEQEQTTLRTYARQKETDLLNREAQIYYTTYQKMQSKVAQFAQGNDIALVLRFDSEDMNPTNRADVIKGVNRAVVFHHYRDISKYIIQEMGPMTEEAIREASLKQGTQRN